MTGLSTVMQIAAREIRERLRSRAYIITTGLTILIVLGLVILPSALGGGTENSTVGAVGQGNQQIIDTAVALGNANDEPGADPSVQIDTVEYTSRDDGVAALEAGDIDALLVDGSEVVVPSTGGFDGSTIASRLQRAASAVQIQTVIEEQGQQAADIIKLLTTDALDVTTLTQGEEGSDQTRTIVAYFGLILLYMAVLLYGTWILTGVTEEKSNRVVEVLVSSVRPWQILGGKVLGIGTLGLTQLLVTLVAAVVAIRVTGTVDLPNIEVTSVLNLLLWFVIGFLMFAVLFGAAGSLVSRMEDAQTIAMPMTFTAVAGFFISIMTLDNPSGPLAIFGTYFPLTAPFVVPVRASLSALSPLEYILAVAIALVAIGLLTRVAGRIYQGALLRFGSRVGWREAWRSSQS
jgi:ABC-2 type transport system permease protein